MCVIPVLKGSQKSDSPRWTADRYHLRPMVWSVLYLVLRRLIGRSGGGSSSVTSKEVEIAVLRHQLNILRRGVHTISSSIQISKGIKGTSVRTKENLGPNVIEPVLGSDEAL